MTQTEYLIFKTAQTRRGKISESDLLILRETAKTEGFSEQSFVELIEKFQKKYHVPNSEKFSGQVTAKCPSCGSNLPVILKVCEYCGYKFYDDTSEISPDDLIANAESNLVLMAKKAQSSFLSSFFSHYYIFFPLLAVYQLVILIILHTHANDFLVNIFWGSVIAGISAIIIKIGLTFFGKKRKNYFDYKSDFEKFQNQARVFFGIVPKIDALIDQYNLALRLAERSYLRSRKNTIIGYCIFFAVLVGFGLLIDFKYNPEKPSADNYFSKKYAGYFDNTFIVEKGSFEGEMTSYLQPDFKALDLIFELHRDQYENFEKPETNDISLRLKKSRFTVVKTVDFFNNPKATAIVLLKAVIKNKSGSKICDTLIADIRQREIRIFNYAGSVLFTDFVLEGDTVTFNSEFIQKLKTQAHKVDFYSEYQLYDGPIRLK